jgi:hypothetical protein
MDSRLKTALQWTVETILAFIAFTLLGRTTDLVMGSPSIQGVLGILLIAVIPALAVYWLLGWRRKYNVINPTFAHLTIHYSQRNDSPDSTHPARPSYVSDAERSKSYWVSDLLDIRIKRHEISWVSHDGERALMKYFEELEIKCIERNPLPQELGLRLLSDGSLHSEKEFIKADKFVASIPESAQFDDLRLINLYPWYCRLFTSMQRRSAPKRVLFKLSNHQAFEAPIYSDALADNFAVDRQNYAKRPFDSLKRWCKRQGYNYNPRHFTETELLGEIKLRPEV